MSIIYFIIYSLQIDMSNFKLKTKNNSNIYYVIHTMLSTFIPHHNLETLTNILIVKLIMTSALPLCY
jgi:hypothetical protein